jgi:hypothetical protein
MKNTHSIRSGARRSLILATAAVAAIGALATLTPTAFAQQAVGGDGRLRDASNRVGSGGFNDNSSSALPPGLLGNAIVSGEVSGGKGFSGNIPYSAQGAFHGNLGSSVVDNFVAGSTNVQTNGTIVNNAENVHLFLGDSRGVNPPSNFVSTGAQPGYIPAAMNDGQFTSDTRLGIPASAPISSVLPSAIYQTGGTSAGGGQSTYISASSLFGVKTLQTSQQNDGGSQYASSAVGGAAINSELGSGDRVDLSQTQAPVQTLTSNLDGTSSLSGGTLNGLGTTPGISSFATPQASPNGASASPNSNGLSGTGTSGLQGSNSGGASANNPNGLNGPNGSAANGANSAIGTPIDASIGGKANGTTANGYAAAAPIGGTALSGSLNTGEVMSTDLYSKTSNLPSSKYQQMLQRFKTLNPNAKLNSVQQNLLYQAKLQDIKADQTKQGGIAGGNTELKTGRSAGGGDMASPGMGGGGMGGGGTGGGAGGSPVLPATPAPARSDAVIPQQVTGGDKNKPVAISTFTGDENSAGTRELLQEAEDLMKQGKYTTALEKYDQIEQQAPAQPYIKLGRANAELGASYYGLAETHLRDAFMSNPALLSAQLDLRSFLGEDKLQYLVKDLKEIAQANPTDKRPVFLLSYICYNTNNPRGAAAYLDLAQKREGKEDPFFDLLRKNWDLPDVSDQKPDDGGLNK